MPDALPAQQDDPLAGRLAVSVKRACAAIDVGTTKLYELLDAGEIEGYLDGPHRKITTASLRAYVVRRVAASVGVKGGVGKKVQAPGP